MSSDGELIFFEDQDRSLWYRQMISEGSALLQRALAGNEVGTHTLQAAIAAVHAATHRFGEPNRARIVEFYDLLLVATSSPVIELDRAVALAMSDGPDMGLTRIDTLPKEEDRLRG